MKLNDCGKELPLETLYATFKVTVLPLVIDEGDALTVKSHCCCPHMFVEPEEMLPTPVTASTRKINEKEIATAKLVFFKQKNSPVAAPRLFRAIYE